MTELLATDHRAVEGLLAVLDADRASGRHGNRAGLMRQLTIEVLGHSAAEETVVYPAVRAKIDPGRAEQALHDHLDVERTLKVIERLRPDDADFDVELGTLAAQLHSHIADEEEWIFPLLRAAFSPAQLVELGVKAQAVKRRAPTRPHPLAPKRPPGVAVLGPLTGLLDRARDLLGGRR